MPDSDTPSKSSIHGLSLAANAIARLAKLQAYLKEGQPTELEQAITLALAEIRQEYGLDG